MFLSKCFFFNFLSAVRFEGTFVNIYPRVYNTPILQLGIEIERGNKNVTTGPVAS
jgi:hypothetical protein